jgi:hypothetical protein
MRNILISLGSVLFILIALYVAYKIYEPGSLLRNDEQVFCTMEAKICPDGSSVGRVPPTCEFAACPASTPAQSGETVTLTTKIDQGASGLGIKIIPLAVLEDSRCPVDVQCIQAGTVRIQALLTSGMGEATQTFELRKPVTTEAEIVELVEVRPESHSETPIDAFGYTFIFKVTKR